MAVLCHMKKECIHAVYYSKLTPWIGSWRAPCFQHVFTSTFATHPHHLPEHHIRRRKHAKFDLFKGSERAVAVKPPAVVEEDPGIKFLRVFWAAKEKMKWCCMFVDDSFKQGSPFVFKKHNMTSICRNMLNPILDSKCHGQGFAEAPLLQRKTNRNWIMNKVEKPVVCPMLRELYQQKQKLYTQGAPHSWTLCNMYIHPW